MIRLCYWLALLLCAPLAVAQTSAAKKDLVNRVVVSQRAGIEGIAASLAERSVGPLTQAAARALTQVPADKRDALAKSVEADIRKYLDETIPLLRERAVQLAPSVIGTMLEEKFTEEELQQLAAWLESPLNKKYLQAAPEMQNALAKKLVDDNRGVIEPKLRATEERVMKTLGLKTSGEAASAPAKPAQQPAPKPARKP